MVAMTRLKSYSQENVNRPAALRTSDADPAVNRRIVTLQSGPMNVERLYTQILTGDNDALTE